MKKLVLSVVAALVALASLSSVAMAQRQWPYWQKVPVTWVSSKVDGSARAYTTSSVAPVEHQNGTLGWSVTLFDTSAAINVQNAYITLGRLARGADADTTDVYPFFRASLNHDPSGGVDSTMLVVQWSKDGNTWASVDSVNCNPVLATVDWGTVAVSADSLSCISNVLGQFDNSVIFGNDQLVRGEPLLGTPFTRNNLAGARYIRFIGRRDKSTFSGGNTSRRYSIDLSLYVVPTQ